MARRWLIPLYVRQWKKMCPTFWRTVCVRVHVCANPPIFLLGLVTYWARGNNGIESPLFLVLWTSRGVAINAMPTLFPEKQFSHQSDGFLWHSILLVCDEFFKVHQSIYCGVFLSLHHLTVNFPLTPRLFSESLIIHKSSQDCFILSWWNVLKFKETP